MGSKVMALTICLPGAPWVDVALLSECTGNSGDEFLLPHSLVVACHCFAIQCRLSLRESCATFAERKATLGKSARLTWPPTPT